MKKLTATAFVSLAAALIAAPALASDERGGPRGAMPQLPAFAEIAPAGAEAFSLADWRAFVTARAETRRAERIEARVSRLFEAADGDGDGAITREEAAAGFQAMDEARRAQMAERRAERGDDRAERGPRGPHMRGWQHGGHGGGHRGGFGAMMAMDPDERVVRGFQRMDRDGDGQVTEAEYTRMSERMQARMDRHQERRARRAAD